MSAFAAYSQYYDLIYRDKDYKGEVAYLDKIINSFSPGARSILELGCGTGMHARFFAELGYSLHGVERSEDMLKQACCLTEQYDRLAFSHGDIRTVKLGSKFDLVMALFHVISYLPANEDILSCLQTVRAHLRPRGLFIFDCWYGPAVLTDKPAVRVKRVSDQQVDIIRIAEPVLHPNDNIVDVNYEILILDRGSSEVKRIQECHSMRYLFVPEIAFYLMCSGFDLIHKEEWMTGSPLDSHTWGALFVAQAV
jgi:SAM-dependent methyltransferase